VAFPQEAGEELIVKRPVKDLGQFQVSEKEPQGLPGGRVGKLLLQGGPQMGGPQPGANWLLVLGGLRRTQLKQPAWPPGKPAA
jgi:hypothetical protein